jgi:hypothetical protein
VADRRECSIGHTAEEHRIHECPHLGLAWSGLAVQSDIDAAFETLIERARLIGPWAATVHVTVHPEAHDVFFVNPPWHNDPSGRDATVALADHVLDAYPWQRLRPSQAGHLPKPLHRLVSYDPASGELRMGRLDHWLREPATVRRSEFARAMRSMLGRAVITRDLAWEGMQQLPTSWPRPTGELLIEAPAVDLDTVPVDGYERTHPSLGVGPLELLSLRRGGYFHDVVEISLPLRHWLEGLARVAYIDDEPVRRIVDALADADVGQRHTLNHLSALHGWLVGRLTPALVAAAGFGDAEVLASRLLPAGPRQLSSDTIQVLLEVLAEVSAHDPGALARNPYEDSPAARTTNSIAHETGAAACLGQPRGRLNAFINILGQLRTMLWEGTPFDDQTPRNLWWSGARDLWSDAVREAYERASVADTRRAHIWREAEPFAWPTEAFADAGAATAYRTKDPEAAWDAAVSVGLTITPVSGTELISTLTDRLPPDLIEAGWAEARRTMARIPHPSGRRQRRQRRHCRHALSARRRHRRGSRQRRGRTRPHLGRRRRTHRRAHPMRPWSVVGRLELEAGRAFEDAVVGHEWDAEAERCGGDPSVGVVWRRARVRSTGYVFNIRRKFEVLHPL